MGVGPSVINANIEFEEHDIDVVDDDTINRCRDKCGSHKIKYNINYHMIAGNKVSMHCNYCCAPSLTAMHTSQRWC